ncbi:MAG: membrane protein insertase YidC [Candidatus Omnitrophota bacterium]
MDSQSRLLIAVALSVAVLVIYQAKHQPANRITTVSQQQKADTVSASANETIGGSDTLKQARPGTTDSIENQALKIELTSDGARIRQIWLKNYKDTKTNEPTQMLDSRITDALFTGPLLTEDMFLQQDKAQQWEVAEKRTDYIKYTFGGREGVVAAKEIFFHNTNYGIALRLSIANKADISTPVKYKILGGSGFLIKQAGDANFLGADIKIGQDAMRLNPRKYLNDKPAIFYNSPTWISMRGRYFSLALEPKQQEQACFIEKEDDKHARMGIVVGPTTLKPGETVTNEFVLYAGPNDTDQIKKVSANMEDVITYGKLTPISMMLLKLLRFFNGVVNNYGLSIIMLVALTSLVLFPLTGKGLRSMKEMQQLQPEIEELRKEHKNNPQKLQKEMMELYKKHKINPLGGCLPMFLQMPVFIALYQVLMRSVELKGARFLWIKDLSEPDAAFKLPTAIPLLGQYINILPLLMIGAMFLQQKISQPKTGQTEQQKMMAVMMPLMFGIMFYNLPSGLVLYWLTNTVIMVFLQEFALKSTPSTSHA